MKQSLFVLCLLGSSGAAALAAQDGAKTDSRPDVVETPPPADAAAIDHLILELGSGDFATRERARERLFALGKVALPALRVTLSEARDPEVRWQARRLVRQIESPRGERGLQKTEAHGQDPDDGAEVPDGLRRRRSSAGSPGLDARFEEMFQRLEQDFGVDVPRDRFFGQDFFKDLETRIDTMQRSVPFAWNQVQGTGQGISMEITPERVRVQVKEQNEQGEEDSKVYEAPDLETFRTKYPEVANKYLPRVGGRDLWLDFGGNHGGRGFGPGPGQPLRRHPGLSPVDPQPDAQANPVPPGERLGVYIDAELSADLREFLGMEPGQGLRVTEVVDGELAARLGVANGDILLRINGKPIVGPQSIRVVLGPLDDTDAVELELARRGKVLTLRGTKVAKTTGKLR
jgi:hypothetical protein